MNQLHTLTLCLPTPAASAKPASISVLLVLDPTSRLASPGAVYTLGKQTAFHTGNWRDFTQHLMGGEGWDGTGKGEGRKSREKPCRGPWQMSWHQLLPRI